MSRLLALALLGVALLLAPSALAQGQNLTGATLTLRDLPTKAVVTNQTFLAQRFDAELGVDPGACTTGGTAALELKAASSNKSLAVSVSPATVVYNLGQSLAVPPSSQRDFQTEFTVFVSTPQLVTQLTNATITVTATPSFSCSTPVAGMAPSVAAATGTFPVQFKPDLADQIAGNNAEAMPGFETVALVAAVAVALAVVRRKQA
jgi:hypothetical protein